MSRKKKIVCQCFQPKIKRFQPIPKPKNTTHFEILYRNELEALKLHDVDALTHLESAKHMGISQPTFSRLLTKAYKTVATALVTGSELYIIDEKEA